jgi:hypothetical protein
MVYQFMREHKNHYSIREMTTIFGVSSSALDLEELGGKDGFTSKEVKELAGALRERLEKLDAERTGNVKRN